MSISPMPLSKPQRTNSTSCISEAYAVSPYIPVSSRLKSISRPRHTTPSAWWGTPQTQNCCSQSSEATRRRKSTDTGLSVRLPENCDPGVSA
jgi:hypothetical protein